MKYYQMARKVTENSTLLDQESHKMTELCTGRRFPEDVEDPFVVSLDEDHIDGEMATFYMSPAVIARKSFLKELTELGVDNIEVRDVIIRDDVHDTSIRDYVLLNILGRISCADMDRSDYASLGGGLNVIDKLVIDPSKTQGLDLFLVHEDTDCIVISERVYAALAEKGYTDLYFEELEQV